MIPYRRFDVSLIRTLLETETITFSDAIYIYIYISNKTTIEYPEIQTMRLRT